MVLAYSREWKGPPMDEGVRCPSCGSKRTTEMGGGERPAAIWCHACGAISDPLLTVEAPSEDRLTREVTQVLEATRR
jgi:uncharacterized Zn finger protein